MTNREDLLNKLEALLEKTLANGCTEGEARLAAAKAQELMAKHGLSVNDLKAASPTDVCGADWVYNGKKKAHESRYTAPAIAEFTDTRVWGDRQGEDLVVRFYGIKEDVAVAVYLFKTFQSAMDFEWTRFWTKNADLTEENPKTARKSFMAGMYRRLSERLHSLKQERDKSIDPQNDIRTIVLMKGELVTKGWNSLGIKLRTGRKSRTSVKSSEAFRAGQDAGSRVGIDGGRLE